jgi:Class III cytochrome C family
MPTMANGDQPKNAIDVVVGLHSHRSVSGVRQEGTPKGLKMMRTTITTILLVLYCAVATAVTTFPASVTVNEAAKKQPAVTFNHAKHATLVPVCDTCHHTQKGLKKDARADVVKCSACHLDPKANVPSMREMNLQKNPFHVRCISCHKTQKKGPVACSGCHVKK